MADMFYPGQKDYIARLNELADRPQGGSASLSIGTVEEGDTASATITGDESGQALNLVLPKGDKGDKGDPGEKGDTGDAGPQGVPGPAGVAPRGAWSSDVDYAVNDLATWAGSTWLRLVAGTTPTTPDADPANWAIFAQAGADGSGGGGGSGAVSVTAPLTSTGGANPTLGISAATGDTAGSMSAADKAKLDGIAADAAAVSSDVPESLGDASAGTSASASRADHVHPLPTPAALGAVAGTAVGAANGVAPLGADGKVAAAYLPGYVDDVLEYANLAAFPAAGETGKIYVADDTGRIYRWSGSAYIEISPSPGSTDAVPEGATNQYFTPSRVLGAVLSGLSTATNAAITAADSVLSAFGKLQKQISAIAASIGVAGGLATLGADGLVPASQLPSSGGPQTGDVLYTARNPGAGYLKADGSVYSQSAYPGLFSVIGLQPVSGAFGAPVAATGGVASLYLRAVCFRNGMYVGVGSVGSMPTIITSSDGVTWTSRTIPITAGYNLYGVAYGNGLFVAVGVSSCITSPDGITWTKRTIAAVQFNGVCYVNGLYVAVGNSGTLATSPDGITWTTRTSGFGTNAINGVCYGNGLFVAVGNAGILATSPDGITWTTRTSGFGGNAINRVCYGNGLFVAVGGSGVAGTTATSPDGITWTTRTSGFGTNLIYDVCYGNGLFVAVGVAGILATSPDGITWTTRTSGFGTSTIFCVCYGNALYLAGGGPALLYEYFATTYDPTSQFSVPSLPSYTGATSYIKT